MVDSYRFVVSMIVREVGASHNESIGSLDQLCQRHAECAAGIVTLISHNYRDQFELPNHPLQKRQLVLDRMLDRKSTRLNSSHLGISYAVFCLKKKQSPDSALT